MRSRWPLLAAGWTLFGLVQAAFGAALLGTPGDAFVWLLAHELPLAWFWALATPLAGAWARGLRDRGLATPARLAAHLPPLLLAALLHTALRRALAGALGSTVAVPFEVTALYYADVTVASWLAAVWAARALDARSRLVERGRQAHALGEQLARARMECLELQLRPHFLFNVLGTVSELAHEAPRTAARVLESLRSLLAAAVAGSGSGPVPLEEEMRGLAPYLAIQRLRFADWLVIEEEMEERARRALVPRFILQPLVENAIQHGLSGRSARGRIGVRARVEDGRLLVSVVDNGVGLPAGDDRGRKGMGLANARARLATLYGPDATIELGQAGPGVEALLDVPFREAAGTTVDGEAHAGGRTGAAGAGEEGAAFDEGRALADPPTPAPSHLLVWARRHPALAVALAWTVLAGLRVQHSFAYMWLRDRYTPAAFLDAIRHDVGAAALWCALTPLVFGVARRFPLHISLHRPLGGAHARRTLLAALSIHLLGALLVPLAHTALTHVLTGGELPLLSGAYAQVYAWDVAVYAILVVVAHAQDLELWIRERETQAARLRRDLEQARLQGVLLELRPGVLLDCLERLGEIVVRDARRAERVLAELGAFLRVTLDTLQEEEVPLRRECEGVRAYGRVLAVATAPGLEIGLVVPPPLMEEPVPPGLLRRLVDDLLEGRSEHGLRVRVEVAAEGGDLLVSAGCSAGSGDGAAREAGAEGGPAQLRLRIPRRGFPDRTGAGDPLDDLSGDPGRGALVAAGGAS